MNTSSQMNRKQVLKAELQIYISDHRDLDEAIAALDEAKHADPLTLRRLKKQKLALKDRISRIEDELTPDIIA